MSKEKRTITIDAQLMDRVINALAELEAHHLAAVNDFGGEEGYHDAMAALLVAFGKNHHESRYFKNDTDRKFSIIHALFQLEYAMLAYNIEQRRLVNVAN